MNILSKIKVIEFNNEIEEDIAICPIALFKKIPAVVFDDAYGDGVALVENIRYKTYHELAKAYDLNIFDFQIHFVLSDILAKIKEENITLSLQYDNVRTISQENSNEIISNILLKYGIEDDLEELQTIFGNSGADKIRRAQRGLYD